MTISGLSEGFGSSSVTIPLPFLNVNERVIPVISSAIIFKLSGRNVKHGVLTWIGENRGIPRNPPDGRRVPPARIAGTCPPAGMPVPANARHIVPRMRVAAAAVASADVCHIASVWKSAVVRVFAAAATLSVAGLVARFEVVRPPVAAFVAVADIVLFAAVFASAVAVPAFAARDLPSARTGCLGSSPFSDRKSVV